MMACAKKKTRKLNRKGGIEGLPLELMIIVVVAALGTATLVGWMGGIEGPETIGDVDCSLDQITMAGDTARTSLTITVTDGSGDGIKGATVVLTGCGISNGRAGTVYGTTNDSGTVSFSNLTLTKSVPGVGYVSVHVSSPDHGEDSSLRIPVVR